WKGPVFVFTYRPPDANLYVVIMFISNSVNDTIATAKTSAADKAVIVFRANLATQYLRINLVDKIVIHLVPVLLNNNVQLLSASDLDPILLNRTLVATSGQITDLRFAVRRQGLRRAPIRAPSSRGRRKGSS